MIHTVTAYWEDPRDGRWHEWGSGRMPPLFQSRPESFEAGEEVVITFSGALCLLGSIADGPRRRRARKAK